MQVTKEFFNIVVRMLIYKRLIVIISYAQNNNDFYLQSEYFLLACELFCGLYKTQNI